MDDFWSKMTFSFVDTAHEENEPWLAYYGIKPTEGAKIMTTVLDGTKQQFSLKHEGNINSGVIEQFVRDSFDEKLDADMSNYNEEL